MTNKEISHIPYEIGDTLIFHDAKGVFDTIVIKNKFTVQNTSNPLTTDATKYESLIVIAEFPDPYTSQRITGEIIRLRKYPDVTTLSFSLCLGNSTIPTCEFSINELDRMPRILHGIDTSQYLDAVGIFPNKPDYRAKNSWIDTFLWDREYGYIRAQSSENKWELSRRIR